MNLPWHHTFLSLHLSAAFTIRLPSDSTSRWTPLSLAVSFPLLGRIRNFHPLVTCAARRTKKTGIAFFHAIPVSFFIYHLFTVKYFDMMFYILIRSKYHCLIHIKVIMCTFCCQIVFYFFCQALKACCCNINFADSK